MENASDLYVRLYDLDNYMNELNVENVQIRRAMVFERHFVTEWVKEHFSNYWVSECEAAFSHQPVDCFIAIKDKKEIVGFACVDTTFKGFFGPLGVKDSMRRMGLGRALTLVGLQDLKNKGYQYAIIGGTRISNFYKDACGAVEIKDSSPGAYKGIL